MSFFDAPWHIALLLLAALVLFGSSRLPGAAKALGSSMNIFKRSLKEGASDDQDQPDGTKVAQVTVVPSAPPLASRTETPAAQAATQQEVAELKQQLAELKDLQRQSAGGGDAAANSTSRSEAPRDQQSN